MDEKYDMDGIPVTKDEFDCGSFKFSRACKLSKAKGKEGQMWRFSDDYFLLKYIGKAKDLPKAYET